MDFNEKRLLELVAKYNFDFSNTYRSEIQMLLKNELENYVEGSSEYLRFLCGYLYCIGDIGDLDLIKKVKYSINMDVGAMIDAEWISSLGNEAGSDRAMLIDDFVDWYQSYEDDM